jgi:two-component system nitrogen regulation response regulator GlnG
VLLVDDDPLVQRIGSRLFAEPIYACSVAASAAEAQEQLPKLKPDVVILNDLLPDGSGLDLLEHMQAFDRRLPVLLITVTGASGNTIEAMKRGAFDLLAKPLDPSALLAHVQRALQARRLMLAPVQMAAAQRDADSEVLVGQSEAMREVYKSIGRVATHEVPVLIAGEAGTGKELAARLVFENGPRAQRPFLTIKCSDFALPWLESELFGHEPGGVPGATLSRPGKIEQCDGGVLLLKEVGDLPLSTQSKLIELLREKRFQRLGGNALLASDVTVLATTSEDLSVAVSEGRFQTDLFYALGAFTITLPALRDRRDDIPLLVDHFVKRLTRIERTYSGEVPRVSPEALDLLSQYDWPGNIDELQSVLKRSLIEGKGTVLANETLTQLLSRHQEIQPPPADDATHWRRLVEQGLAGGDQLYDLGLAEMERRLLPLVMQRCGGSQVKAARALGITRGSLRKKLRLHGLMAPPASADDAETASFQALES